MVSDTRRGRGRGQGARAEECHISVVERQARSLETQQEQMQTNLWFSLIVSGDDESLMFVRYNEAGRAGTSSLLLWDEASSVLNWQGDVDKRVDWDGGLQEQSGRRRGGRGGRGVDGLWLLWAVNAGGRTDLRSGEGHRAWHFIRKRFQFGPPITFRPNLFCQPASHLVLVRNLCPNWNIPCSI